MKMGIPFTVFVLEVILLKKKFTEETMSFLLDGLTSNIMFWTS